MQDVPKKTAVKRIEALLEFLDLEKHTDREVKEYSSGMKIKLLLARALLHNPILYRGCEKDRKNKN